MACTHLRLGDLRCSRHGLAPHQKAGYFNDNSRLSPGLGRRNSHQSGLTMAAPCIWRPISARPRPVRLEAYTETFFLASRRAAAAAVATHIHCIRSFSSSSPPTASPHEPLRILFCGSDDFSCASLQALYNEMQRQKKQASATADAPGHIASLDVVVRPAKRTGRGRTTIIESMFYSTGVFPILFH